MPTPKLYSPCRHCNGTGTHPLPGAGAVVVACRFCLGGFCEVGVTEGQLEGIIEERDRLLEFVARVAVAPLGDCVNELENETVTALGKEAGALVKDKGARVEEYRIRRGVKPGPAPLPPA